MKQGNKIENQIIDAWDIYFNQLISKAGYDKTIQAVIQSCEDETTGKYKVKYQDSSFYAYSLASDKKYYKNTAVYITIPNNDFSNQKIIIGEVNKISTAFAKVYEPDELFNKISMNYIENSETITIGTKEPDGIRGSKPNFYENFCNDFNNEKITHYMLSFKVKTNFKTKPVKGSYGVWFYDKQNSDKEAVKIIFDSSEMRGDIYNYKVPTKQIKIFEARNNTLNIEDLKIRVYSKDFNVSQLNDAIEFSDFEFYIVESPEITSDYQLHIETPNGSIINPEEPRHSKPIVLKPVLKIDGKVATDFLKKPSTSVYWFVRSLSNFSNTVIEGGNQAYWKKIAGDGWNCINDRSNIGSSILTQYDALFTFTPKKYINSISNDFNYTFDLFKRYSNGNFVYIQDAGTGKKTYKIKTDFYSYFLNPFFEFKCVIVNEDLDVQVSKDIIIKNNFYDNENLSFYIDKPENTYNFPKDDFYPELKLKKFIVGDGTDNERSIRGSKNPNYEETSIIAESNYGFSEDETEYFLECEIYNQKGDYISDTAKKGSEGSTNNPKDYYQDFQNNYVFKWGYKDEQDDNFYFLNLNDNNEKWGINTRFYWIQDPLTFSETSSVEILNKFNSFVSSEPNNPEDKDSIKFGYQVTLSQNMSQVRMEKLAEAIKDEYLKNSNDKDLKNAYESSQNWVDYYQNAPILFNENLNALLRNGNWYRYNQLKGLPLKDIKPGNKRTYFCAVERKTKLDNSPDNTSNSNANYYYSPFLMSKMACFTIEKIEEDYTLEIKDSNNFQTYEYDKNNKSPFFDLANNKFNTSPTLSFVLKNKDGKTIDITKDKDYQYTWIFPNKNTVLNFKDLINNSKKKWEPNNEFNIIENSNLSSISYTLINDLNDKDNESTLGENPLKNNIVKLKITHKNKDWFSVEATAEFDIVINYEDNYNVKIIPNISENKATPACYYATKYGDSNDIKFNFTPKDLNMFFKAKLYNGNTEVNEEEYSIDFDLEKNHYRTFIENGEKVNISDFSYFDINNINGENKCYISFNENIDKPVNENNLFSSYPTNVLKAIANINNQSCYGYLPISTIYIKGENVPINILKTISVDIKELKSTEQDVKYKLGNMKDGIQYPIITIVIDTDLEYSIDNLSYKWTSLNEEYQIQDKTFKTINNSQVGGSHLAISSVWINSSQIIGYIPKKLADTNISMLGSINNAFQCNINAILYTLDKSYPIEIIIHIPFFFNRELNYLVEEQSQQQSKVRSSTVQTYNSFSKIVDTDTSYGILDSQNNFKGIALAKVVEEDDVKTGLLGYTPAGARSVFIDADTGKTELGSESTGMITVNPYADSAQITSANYADLSEEEAENLAVAAFKIDLKESTIRYNNGKFSVNNQGELVATLKPKNIQIEVGNSSKSLEDYIINLIEAYSK